MSIRDDVDYEDDQREQQIKKRKKLMNFSIESIMQPAAAAAAVVAAAASAAATNNNIKSSPSAATPVNHEQLNSARLNQIECQLDNKDMWDKFHSLNTEMIITKTGRRMFPVMKVQFQNLNPTARYSVAMDIVPVDNKRYRYAYHKSCWQVAGKADPSAETRLYMHPDSPFNGDLLSRQVISFEKVKLTNNEMDKSGHIILNSMHKYQPRVYLIELKSPPPPQNHQLAQQATAQLNHHHRQTTSKQHQSYYQQSSPNGQQQQQQQQPQLQSDIEGYRTFVFPETVFTAVTAYQNQLITKMKIDKNPFAKGFRDSSRLSDLDRSDPFDYMSSLSSSARFLGQHASSMPPGPGPSPGSLDHHSLAAAAAAAAGANLHPHPMDAYQLLASAAANNPWYSAAAMAAAAGGNLPFNSMMGPITNTGAASNNSAASPTGPPQQPLPPPPTSSSAAACSQAAQLQATQMWLAAFSACLYGSGGCPPTSQQQQHHLQQQQQQQHNQQHSQHQQPTSPALPSSANSSPPIPDQLINETSGGCDSSENSSSY